MAKTVPVRESKVVFAGSNLIPSPNEPLISRLQLRIFFVPNFQRLIVNLESTQLKLLEHNSHLETEFQALPLVPMAKHPTYGVHAPGFTLFLISLQYPLFLLALSLAYTIQTKHFINCGSSKTINYFSRDFVGDASSGSSISFTKQSTSAQSSNQSSSDSASSMDLDVQKL